MVRKIVYLYLLPALLTPVMLPAAASAQQDSVLSQLYGAGVHAYFSNDYITAHEYLTTAIDGGSRDPRAFYFRALVYSKLGREEDASQDFARGSELELQDGNLAEVVSRALIRVQGHDRRTLETYRTEGRIAMYQRQARMRAARTSPAVRQKTAPKIGQEPAERDQVIQDEPPANVFGNDPPEAEPIDEAGDDDMPLEDEPAPAKKPVPAGADSDPFGKADVPAGDDAFGGDDVFGDDTAIDEDKAAAVPPVGDGRSSGSIGKGVTRAIGKAILGGGSSPAAGGSSPVVPAKPEGDPFGDDNPGPPSAVDKTDGAGKSAADADDKEVDEPDADEEEVDPFG